MSAVILSGGRILGSGGAVYVQGVSGNGFFADPYAAYATIYWDPVSGNDTWTGSSRIATGPNGPKLTLGACAALMTGNHQRIFALNTGIYTLTADVNWPTNTASGVNQIVLQGDPVSATCFKILRTNGAKLFPNASNSANNLCFRKIEMYSNDSGSPISGETALLWYGPDFVCSGMTVEYCILHDVYGTDNTSPVFFQGVHSNFVFQYSKFYNAYNSGGTSNHNGACLFTYQTPNVLVDHCDLSAGGCLIYMKRCSPSTGATNGWTITNNIFHDAPGNDSILVSEQGGGDVGGFFGVLIQNNLFYNVGQCVDQANNENTVQSSGFVFIQNTVAQDVTNAFGWRAMLNITYYNNVEMPSTINLALLDASSPNGFVNTISEWDYNAILTTQGQVWWMDRYGASPKQYTTLSTWRTAFSVDARPELSANPDTHSTTFTSIPTNFPNYLTRDYTLAGGSPLKGTGQGSVDPGYNSANCGPGW